MKNLITSAACLLLILALLLQCVQFQMLFVHVLRCESAATTFCEEIRREGCVTEMAEERFRTAVQKELSCDPEDISVQGSQKRVPEGGLLEVRLSFPLEKLVLAPSFWGIRKEENRTEFVIRRSIVSEYLEEVPKEEETPEEAETKNAETKNPEGTAA